MHCEQKHARVNRMMYVIREVLLTELFFNLDVGVIHDLPPHFELHTRNFSTAWNVMSSGQTVLVCSVSI